MLYICLDTCVWLGLIKIDLHQKHSIFEELCFWIENKYIIHIAPENIIREWNRNKEKRITELTKDIKILNTNIISTFKGSFDLVSAYQPNIIEVNVSNRYKRVDTILKTNSEKAVESQEIYNEAIERNFSCLAPNHDKDSFRDTINIITLVNYLKRKKITNCIFSTINYKDFSEKDNKHSLHNDLIDYFIDANLEYVYCDEKPFGSLLFGKLLRPYLPNYNEYLAEKQIEEEKKNNKKDINLTSQKKIEDEFLQNIRHIDLILSKKKPTDLELNIIRSLVNSHDSYKQYFLKNIGNNGLV